MFQAFKDWCVDEWAKQGPFEKRMIINSAPAMFFCVLFMASIAIGAPLPILTLGPIAGAVQLVWSSGYIGFLVWRRWREARADYETKSEWREKAELSDLRSHIG